MKRYEVAGRVAAEILAAELRAEGFITRVVPLTRRSGIYKVYVVER